MANMSMALLTGLLLSTAVCAAPPVNALPIGETIAGGSAIFNRNITNQLSVVQQSEKLITNWNSFDIGSTAQVNFTQPNALSIALNRINNGSPTEIFGQLNANGQVFVVNPSGVVFGAASQVNVGGLLASTFSITDTDFNNDHFVFNRNGSESAVNNQGSLVATQGNVVLLASSISNEGTIQANNGNISLANANRATLNQYDVSIGLPINTVSVMSSRGLLSANRIESNKGQVYLLGDRSRAGSKLVLGGTVDAKSSLIRGRQIYINNDLTLKGNAALDAVNNIYINAPVHAVSHNRLLSVAHGDKAGEGIKFSVNGKLNLSGANIKYRANNQYYQVIKTLEQLQAIDIDEASLAGKYVLGVDIDAAETTTWNFGAGFSPIGGGSTPFSGVLDGLGHQVSNLHIYRPDFDENSSQGGAVFPDPYGFSGYNVGLFGVAQNSTLQNINLANVNIVGYENVGGLVGLNHTTVGGHSRIENNTVSGAIRGAYTAEETCISYECEVEGGGFDGYFFTGGHSIGGLIGLNQVNGASIINLNNTHVDLSGNANTGGLVGYNVINNLADSVVQWNTSQGSVSGNGGVGGLIGRNTTNQNGHILMTINHADANLTGSIYQLTNYAGGLVGFIDTASGGLTELKSNYAAGNIAGDGYLGGLLGLVSTNGGRVNIIHNYATSNVTGKIVLGGLIGFNSVRTGSINIQDTYASGKVAGNYNVGGLIGINGIYVDDPTKIGTIRIANSYWDIDTTLQGQAIGAVNTAKVARLNAVSGAGGSYPNAYSQGAYTNFDFDKTWFMSDAGSRPMLRAFLK